MALTSNLKRVDKEITMRELISEDKLADAAEDVYKALKKLVGGQLNPQQMRAAASGANALISFKRLEQNGNI